MKKTKKIITILMLISMISSFLSPLCVNALTSGDVYNYITNTKTTYNNLKTKLEVSKNETKYIDDETFLAVGELRSSWLSSAVGNC